MTRRFSIDRITILAVLIASACSQSRDISAPVTVSAATEVVRMATIPDVRVTTGTVRHATVASLASRLLGNVTRVLVSEGDRVRAGQILVEIDDREVRAKAEQAQAAARAADEAIASATAAIDAAEANAQFADATYKRFAALRERGSVSPHEFEEVAAKQKAARAELERARGGRDQLLAQRAQAHAAVSEAEAFLSYAVLRSPIDGTVSARFVDPGAQAAPGMPLIAVEGGGGLQIDTTVDETLAPLVRTGENADVDGVAARVAHVAPVDPATRSAVVKIELPATSTLRPGTFVHVSFPVGTRSSLRVPTGAVVRNGSLANVFVVDDQGAAHMRVVTIGAGDAERVEVLSGIDAGERVIITAAGIRDGIRVRSAS